MEFFKSKACVYGFVFLLFLMGLLTKFSNAVSADELQSSAWTEQDIPDPTYLQAFRDELRRELASFAEAEERIGEKMRELEEERNLVRTKKRGHTQCFLNLVSCYRKRK